MKKYLVEKIDNDTFMISEYLGGVHCYLIIGEERAVLIDTGNGAGRLDKVVSQLTNLPITVINTHGHKDHIGGNYLFTSARLSESDQEIVTLHSDKKFIMRNFKQIVPFYLRFIVRIFAPYMLKLRSFNANYNLHDREIIDLGNRKLEVIAIPGHTKGSVCIFERNSNNLFCGDSIVQGKVLLNLEGSLDVDVYLDSLLKLKENTNEETKFFPGHLNSPISFNYLEKFINCAEQVIKQPNADLPRGYESGVECMYYNYEDIALALPVKRR